MAQKTKEKKFRGRPKKGFLEVENKINEKEKHKETRGKGRPKKEKKIKDSINTQISSNHKIVSSLQKNNEIIHQEINSFSYKKLGNSKKTKGRELEGFDSKIVLFLSFVVFVIGGLSFLMYMDKRNDNISSPQVNGVNMGQTNPTYENFAGGIDADNANIDQTETTDPDINGENIDEIMGDSTDDNIATTSNNESGITRIDTIQDNSGDNAGIIRLGDGNGYVASPQDGNTEQYSQQDESIQGNNDGKATIATFYEKMNNKEFDALRSMVDTYLRKSDVFMTYYNDKRLSNFLGKLVLEKVFLTHITELPSEKENVQIFSYTIKYKVKDNDGISTEQWKASVINKNGTYVIGSLMCETTGCSKMPFFQK